MIDVIVGPIEPLQIVVCAQNTVITVGSEQNTVFVVNAGIPGPQGSIGPTGPQGPTGPHGPAASVPEYFDSLNTYVSNYEAIHTGGLGLNDWYIAGLGHQAVQSGVPVKTLELE